MTNRAPVVRINWRVIDFAKIELARRMILVAKAVVSEANRRMSRPYPRASRRGEYPRQRTKRGRLSIDYSPKTPGGVVRAGRVRIFHKAEGWYMDFLKTRRGRKGIADVYNTMGRQIERIMDSPSGEGTGKV